MSGAGGDKPIYPLEEMDLSTAARVFKLLGTQFLMSVNDNRVYFNSHQDRLKAIEWLQQTYPTEFKWKWRERGDCSAQLGRPEWIKCLESQPLMAKYR